MYVPRHFAIDAADDIARFVDTAGAADIVTFDGARLMSTLAPIVWDRSVGEHGRLLAHFAIANPQWRAAKSGGSALAIVHGPQAYVSPSWYPSKDEHGRAVPTWNYISVHFTGQIAFHTDVEWLRDVVTRLTEKHEQGRENRWFVDDAPAAYIEAQLRGIVGVEIDVTTVEAKAKLSQNRSAADQNGVLAGLRQEPGHGAAALADAMAENLAARPSG